MRHRSLTLVECLLASVVLAFAVVAVSQAVVAGQMQTAEALHRARGAQLAEALLDEVLRLPCADPDGGGGEAARASFDNLEDFNGFSEAPGNVRDAGGALYDAPYQKFSRSVSVVPANGGGITVTGFGDPLPGLMITVIVQDTGGTTWTLTRFRAQPPA